MKIKWVNPSHSFQPVKWVDYEKSDSIEGYGLHVNPSYYIIKSYYKYKSPNNYKKLEWLEPVFKPMFEGDSEQIIEENPDILCLSFFLWNFSKLSKLATEIKKSNPQIIIIAGGPDLDAHKRQNFFEEHPYIDYVVYGDGEEGFASIMDSIISSTPLPDNSVNIVTKDRKYPHRVFSDKIFWNTSYVLDMKDDIEKDIQNLLKTGMKIRMHWELDRGCPYACAFCDWSSGLHHKVKRRSKYWKEELEFLTSFPILVKLVNANFGIYQEDVEIAKYIADKKIKNIKFEFFAKMNRDRAWEIMDILSSYDPKALATVSIQDVDEEVLDNISRPFIAWELEREYIKKFNKKYPSTGVYFDIMIGLPGQTVETFKYLLIQIDNLRLKHQYFGLYHWHLLHNTPGANPEYQKKYKMVFEEFFVPTNYFDGETLNADISFEELQRLYNNGSLMVIKSVLAKETYSADWLEIIKMDTITAIYAGLRNSRMSLDRNDYQARKLFYNPQFDKFLDDQARATMESINKNKFWGKWCDVDKKWYTIDTYYYRPSIIGNIIEKFYK